MIEVGAPDAGGADSAAAPAQGQTAGAMLRNAREAAGLHVAALAVAMKVPVAKLEALENDRHNLLPDAVFARALAASVCRTLKIDPAPVLARLPQTGKPRLVHDTDGLNAPFRSPRDTVTSHWKDQLTRPVALTVGALLVGALVVLLLPRQPDEGSPVASTASTGAPATSSPTAPAAGRETAAPPAVAAAVTAPPDVLTASVAMPPPAAAAALPAPAAPAASAAAASAAATASAPAAPAATGVIVFRANAQSWIEVRDAKGAVPVRKLLSTGETAGASGAMPLQVTVGNAGATEVQVRGKPFDLRAITRDNVARFEVK
ncbi:MAG: helix-turn-helix domain-containing protein [Ramlibacter sp.]